MKTNQKNQPAQDDLFTRLAEIIMPRQNGTKEGIAALQASLDRNNKEVKK